jgi:hypothetical protein
MADEVTQDPAAETEQATEEVVPASRFAEMAKHKKASDARAKDLEKQIRDLQAAVEERETAGLPELERERAARQKLEQRLQEAEARAQQQEQAMTIATRERWVAAAAAKLNFHEPDDASRFLDLSALEDPRDAERAVKDLAKNKKHLVKAEDPQVPGRVLENGRPTAPLVPGQEPPGSAVGLVNTQQEAAIVGAQLNEFLKQRQSGRITFDA